MGGTTQINVFLSHISAFRCDTIDTTVVLFLQYDGVAHDTVQQSRTNLV